MSSRSPGERGETEPADVWLVEDNDPYRETLESLLAEQVDFFCSLAVPTCEEMLERLEDGACPDLILVDIGLPGMSGVEGIRRAKDLVPDCSLLVLTVHEDRDTVFDAIRAGASGYLLKSSTEEELLAALREVQAGGAPLTPRIASRILDVLREPGSGDTDYELTAREIEVLEMLVEGASLPLVADRLGLSVHTIDSHVRNIYAKLHVHSRGGAVAKAVRERLVDPD